MPNEGTAAIPQRFPVAMSPLRSVSGSHFNVCVKTGNRNGMANTKTIQSTYSRPESALDTGADSFPRSAKKRRAIKICVRTVTTVIRMSAIPDLYGDIPILTRLYRDADPDQ